MKDFFRQHDLIYEKAPKEWIDGIPIANGVIGGVMWGEGRNTHITLDHYGIWETRTIDPTNYPKCTRSNLRKMNDSNNIKEYYDTALERHRLRFIDNPPPYPTRISIGRLEMKWNDDVIDFNARLDLYKAAVVGKVTLKNSSVIEFSCLIASLDNALILTFESDKKEMLPEIYLVPAVTDANSDKHFKSWKYNDPVIENSAQISTIYRKCSEELEYSMVCHKTYNGDSLTAVVTIAKFKLPETINMLEEMESRGIDIIKSRHEKDWENYWKRSAIRIPDSLVENLYYLEMYKLYCSTRNSKESYPITLQGVWTTDGSMAPWRGSYTTDLNVQASYWPVCPSNNLDLNHKVFDMYLNNMDLFRKLGKHWLGEDIAVIPGEHGPNGEPFIGRSIDDYSPGSNAWIAQMFWLHYLYSADKNFLLNKCYPFMRESLKFFLCIIEKWDDGKYHIPYTESPEFFSGRPDKMTDDVNYDIAFLKFLLKEMIEVQDELPSKDPDLDKWIEVRDNLVDFVYGITSAYKAELDSVYYGQTPQKPRKCFALSSTESLYHTHRHHAHLMPIYPLGYFDPDISDEDQTLMDNCLEDLIFSGYGEWVGFSYPWASLIAGRARKKWMPYKFIRDYIDGFVSVNSFNTNMDDKSKGYCYVPGTAMTLEAGFMGAAAILEMLIQSHNKLIRIFPTTPPSWSDIEFKNLRAEGAFVVSAKMTSGEVEVVKVVSEAGKTCRIKNPFNVDQFYMNGKQIDNSEILSFDTKPGETIILSRKQDYIESNEMINFVRHENDSNWFGMKKFPKY